MKKTILLITPENKEINKFRKKQFDGYIWFRKEFYSMKSIIKRLSISKTNIVHNLIVNLGYKFAIGERRK